MGALTSLHGDACLQWVSRRDGSQDSTPISSSDGLCCGDEGTTASVLGSTTRTIGAMITTIRSNISFFIFIYFFFFIDRTSRQVFTHWTYVGIRKPDFSITNELLYPIASYCCSWALKHIDELINNWIPLSIYNYDCRKYMWKYRGYDCLRYFVRLWFDTQKNSYATPTNGLLFPDRLIKEWVGLV